MFKPSCVSSVRGLSRWQHLIASLVILVARRLLGPLFCTCCSELQLCADRCGTHVCIWHTPFANGGNARTLSKYLSRDPAVRRI